MAHLLLVEIHTVPVVSQGGHLAFPVLQEGDGPEGHEDAEEHCTRVIEQVAHLHTDRIQCCPVTKYCKAPYYSLVVFGKTPYVVL